jgi:ABC-type multidrug transport system ATPase subunit
LQTETKSTSPAILPLGLLRQNGAGKSKLMRILATLQEGADSFSDATVRALVSGYHSVCGVDDEAKCCSQATDDS